jgi:transposase
MAQQALHRAGARCVGDGTLSTFLYHGLVERGVAVECICARHAKGVLSARVNKSDVHDAEGLAQLARTGWYKRVHMKASATYRQGSAAYPRPAHHRADIHGQSTAWA